MIALRNKQQQCLFGFRQTGCGNNRFEINQIPASGIVLTVGTSPLTHPRFELCANIIRIEDAQRLRLTIQSLDPDCLTKPSSDWLEILDGNNERSPLIRNRLCDDLALKPFTSKSNELLIRFESHTYGARSGYNITIKKGIIHPSSNRKYFSIHCAWNHKN